MSEAIEFSQIVTALKTAISKLEEKQDDLDLLDSPIGDGDHGRTIVNLFHSITPLLESAEDDIGDLLKQCGRSMAFSGGASAGPLYGTALMDAGKCVAGCTEVGLEDVVEMVKAFEQGIIRRGQANVGDKTMLDTVHPAVVSIQKSLSDRLNLKEALILMKEAAGEGMESTRDLVSQKGRSSRLGERSIGHIDPGAASCYFIIEAAVDSLTQ